MEQFPVIFLNQYPDVLVATRRVVKRFADLTRDEVSDLFLCTHRVVPVIEREFCGTSVTIAVQDGVDAGQTVEHVHVHIIPRRHGDFDNNDDIYHHVRNFTKCQCCFIFLSPSCSH